jgi:hypothetical protein
VNPNVDPAATDNVSTPAPDVLPLTLQRISTNVTSTTGS